MAKPGSTGTQGETAKHVLDEFGQQVYETVKNGGAKTYKDDLKAYVSFASIFGEEMGDTNDPCQLESKYTELISGSGVAARGHPCKKDTNGNDVERFSVKEQAEYDNKKMKCSYGSNGKNEGACASFRRLHLCNKNMVKMDTNNYSKAKHDLLLDVCMAAKFEGESLNTYSAQYDAEYPSGSGHTTCTMLARSFADIGDIVRGRDLYSGNTKEKEKRKQLDDKLKKIFAKIYEKLEQPAKVYYEDKDTDKNYYKLREDWWTANRHTVWKAMTCSEDLKNSSYFHVTCSMNGSGAQANHYCRCNGDKPGNDNPNTDPPTYFDYVPQYLRWFEEWGEDFCRKKKKKLEKLEQQCRGKDKDGNEPRYCSRNGFDCEKTVNARGKVRMGKGCTDCFFACNPYVDWIEKQKEQFNKQVKKYTDEINGAPRSSRQRRNVRSNYDNGYEKIFYKKLKNRYQTVDAFLGLLNEEKACTAVDDKEGGKIDFKTVKSSSASDSGTNDKNEGTFYRSEYCQPCPDCGVRKTSEGKFEHKSGGRCTSGKLYRPKNEEGGTPIRILKSGENRDDIKEKLNAFCAETQNGTGDSNSDSSLYDPWKCYNDVEKVKNGEEEDDEEDVEEVKKAGGLCILENKNKEEKKEKKTVNEPDEIQKTYNDFFYYWVVHMLKDSIYWRTEKIKKCLENGTKTRCKNNEKCNRECECFQRWITQKKEEWMAIKEHFKKQKDFKNEGQSGKHKMLGEGMESPDFVLQQVLKKDVLLTSLQEGYGNAEDIKHIEELLKEEEAAVAAAIIGGENNTTIDKLLEQELKEAEDCQSKHNEEKCKEQKKQQQQEREGLGRADTSADSPPPVEPEEDEDDHDDDDDGDDDDDDEDDEETPEDSIQDTDGEGETAEAEDTVEVTETTTSLDVCNIVSQLFSDPSQFSDACTLKYVTGKNYGWKCVNTTSGSGKDGATGGLCIPPRRRKLYVGHLEKWANSDKTEAKSLKTSDKESSQDPSDKLREAFIQSAAVETFFLWHKYIEEKKPPAQEGARLELPVSESDEETPQTLLQSGKIPPDFLRQMFYTLGDYRDICVGVKDDVAQALKAGGIDISTINEKIKKTLNSDNKETGGTSLVPKPGNTTPESWWNNNAKHIWNGMIYALTYKETSGSGGEGKTPEQDPQVKQALWDDTNNKPKKNEYKYDQVELKEENSGEKKNNDTIQPPTLKQFTSRPPYFRYLEEWGETFCKERKKRLEDVKHNCRDRDNPGHHYCSGDGHDCTDKNLKHKNMFHDLDCPDCYEQCRKYRKWIDKKFEEYQNQKSIYQAEHGKLNGNSNGGGDNNCCTEIKKKNTAADFLAALKHCKDDEVHEEKDDEDEKNKINFKEPLQTFSRSTYCKTCPFNRVKCNGGRNNPCSENGEKWEEVFAKIPKDNENSTANITVEMIDRRWPFIKEYLKKSGNSSDSLFKTSPLFKGIRNQKWECRFNKAQNKDVCKLDQFKDNIDLNEYTTFKVFLVYWLDDFLYGYYILRKRKIMDHCTKSGEKTCYGKSKNDCACVQKWVEKKKNEWGNIKKHFKDREQKDGDTVVSKVRNFLETLIYRMDLKNGKQRISDLSTFLKAYACKCAAKLENTQENDLVLCLLEDLDTKIKTGSCLSQPSGEQTETECQEHTPLPDDEEPLEETENQVAQPNICPKQTVEDKKIEEDESECKAATTPKEPSSPTGISEETPAQAPDVAPEPAPIPPPADQPFDPTILQTTIPFGIAIALTSIVFLFLKVIHIVVGNNPINISDSTNSMDSLTSNNHSPYNDKNDLYSGIDLINDALSGNHIDIYDEMLKRKENELFGTQHHPKNITSNRVVTQTSSDDPITNQINLFHKWLDRHRDMCEKWKNNHERLPKLKELWENETHSGDINSGIPSGNHVLNTDVSIQIDMDNPKTMNEFTNMDTNPDKSTMDTILDDLEKYNEPYYYDFYKDDIYYDVNDDKASEDHINMDHNKMDNNNSDVPTNVQIEMNVINNQELLQNEYPISHM
ncbi:hypothetical protein C923_02126 [Plasmodium falciparum UGT5.1]|uniref:Erythrocyte membrane protein 1 n=1 Tax=Plasmodium falciparum UGT5.1 TaxID=1237627 RepID=W7JE63_PLAFA|nr:hypothetical protein C923_02126 [Plasmodium falciparum UGT5.1]